MDMSGTFGSGAGGMLLAVVGGLLGLGVLYELTRVQCPACGSKIQRGVPACPGCRAVLRWRKA